ncbi:aspartate/methionine/tyrosine aminotransferase [Neobacillus niacini]|uniref:aminotransferase class I/II-fold pyridoxal phosphate-dependent enzyme n=1 Tax=Neobacillus driksii TaxID=3035913 RepID=UPI00277DF60A|nr:aminotransferase class I/II-fold pyridoxal phosphate-dependent enzyme [Neobacillus niacini]MDQ0970461.1 aspartate/methionine/tyrosine aminotransferase [Neobacillus niacini]
MNELALNLNEMIKKNNPHVFDLLSDLGKKLYYPNGILSQSAEATQKATRFNATIGIATEKKVPMHFEHIQETLSEYSPDEVYPYAPPSGKLTLRNEWKRKLLRDNPSLHESSMGLPITTNALTHGLSLTADLFVDENDAIILPDKYWGNYQTIFHVRRGGNLKTFKLFDENDTFNIPSFRECLLQQKDAGKAMVLLNFPNNPTGYTPKENEVQGIISVLMEAAEAGINLAVILDDAYFGLFFEDSVKESLFGRLAGIHPRILPIKVDGATKENYVWGLRVGFLTFASDSPTILEALEQKTNGLIRGTISSSSHLSQTVILRSLQSSKFEEEKCKKHNIMKRRATKVKEIITREEYKEAWGFYPFNSGYFMCLKLNQVDAEELRVHLLNEYGVGTIAISSSDLRIAFSCVEEEDLEELFELIYRGINDLVSKGVSIDVQKTL